MLKPLVSAGLLLAPAGTAALASGGEGGGALPLVVMDEIRVPIVDGARSDAQLRLKLVLEATDAAAATEASGKMPELRATSLATAIEFGRLYASPMMPIDAERLATEMTSAIRATDPGVRRVLITEVMAARI